MSYVNLENIRALSDEELRRALHEDSMPVEQWVAMNAELYWRDRGRPGEEDVRTPEEPRLSAERHEILAAWSEDWDLGRFGRPHYRNPSEVKAAVRDALHDLKLERERAERLKRKLSMIDELALSNPRLPLAEAVERVLAEQEKEHVKAPNATYGDRLDCEHATCPAGGPCQMAEQEKEQG